MANYLPYGTYILGEEGVEKEIIHYYSMVYNF
jgi:hypothetical protein